MAWSKRPFFPSLIKSLSHRDDNFLRFWAEASGPSDFTAPGTEFFVIERSETPLGGAAITTTSDIFFSTDLDDDAVQLLLHALIA